MGDFPQMAVYTGVPVFTWEMWAHWTSNIHNGDFRNRDPMLLKQTG